MRVNDEDTTHRVILTVMDRRWWLCGVYIFIYMVSSIQFCHLHLSHYPLKMSFFVFYKIPIILISVHYAYKKTYARVRTLIVRSHPPPNENYITSYIYISNIKSAFLRFLYPSNNEIINRSFLLRCVKLYSNARVGVCVGFCSSLQLACTSVNIF